MHRVGVENHQTNIIQRQKETGCDIQTRSVRGDRQHTALCKAGIGEQRQPLIAERTRTKGNVPLPVRPFSIKREIDGGRLEIKNSEDEILA